MTIPRVRLLAGLVSCAVLALSPAVGAAAEPGTLDGTAWVLSELPGRALVKGSAVTLSFEGGRVSGTDGCNRYTSPYSVDGAKLRIEPNAAATLMACAQDLTDQAAAFRVALAKATTFRVESGKLTLLSSDGKVTALFAAQNESLTGTSWRVTGLNNGRQGVVSVLDGSSLTMEFAADGKLAGSAGCNRFHAAYTREGAKLAIGTVAATRRMCVKPEGVMEQEHQLLKAFETVSTVRAEGDRLELRTAEGALAVEAVRNPTR
jgi:heat shock protein HslJ